MYQKYHWSRSIAMNDILTSRFKNYPNKNFIFYNNDIIQYKDFYYFVRNAEKNLTNIKYEYVGIQIQDKLKLLIAISALNRLGKIPVIYPNLPNLEDYINQTQVPITLEDKDITCNNKKCAYKKNIFMFIIKNKFFRRFFLQIFPKHSLTMDVIHQILVFLALIHLCYW